MGSVKERARRSRASSVAMFMGMVLVALALFACTVDAAENGTKAGTDTLPTTTAMTEVAPTETAPIVDEVAAATTDNIPTPEAASVSEGAAPGVIARIHLAGKPDRILDFRHDPVSGRLFTTTTDGRLSVFDSSTLELVREYPFGGELTLDEVGRRLYVGPGSQFVPTDEPIVVNILDIDDLEIVDQILGVHAVTVDSENGRLFAGSPLREFDDGRASSTVLVYDLDSLELMYEINHQGVPTYNPYRDELLLTAYTVLVLDPLTGEVSKDLLPELAEQPFRWCNGCEHAMGVHVVDPAGQLVIQRTKFSTGGGPGFSPEDVYLDATTHQEIEPFVDRLPFQPACSTKRIPVPPVGDRIIWQQHFVRYVVYRNFDAHTLDGALSTRRDGLFAPYINARAGQAYTAQGYALDIASMTPVGRIPAFCLLDEDAQTGRIFGRIDGDLIVIDEDGGIVVTAVPTEPEPLPSTGISQITVSPDYINDQTVFLLMEDERLYRTSDGGHSWLRIQGGLPAHENLTLSIAISPDFGSDDTMFAGGFVRDYRGEGVLKSDDAGLTWHPMWTGLGHLRVYDVLVSHDYATDGTVRALAHYDSLSPWESGVSLFESRDQGLSWTQVITASNEREMDTFLARDGVAVVDDSLPIRIVDYGNGLEVRDSGGVWRQVSLEQKDGETIRTLTPSPQHKQDGTYYVLGDYSLWRTMDSGESWARWRDPRLAGRDYDTALTALSVTPQVADGGYRVLVGTRAGEFWILSPQEAANEATKSEIESPEVDITDQDDSNADGSSADEGIAPVGQPSTDFLGAEPPAGRFKPGGALASLWEASPEVRASLGWAMSEVARSIPAAYQPFERGAMIWNGDSQSIFVLLDDGQWVTHEDSFEEGDVEFDPTLIPPGGGLQPIRGFGKVWRDNEVLRDGLGWALAEEDGYTAYIHDFDGGSLLGTPAGTVVLIRDGESGGRWR